MSVFHGVELSGSPNIPHDVMVAQMEYAIRQNHPQIWPTDLKPDRVCIVGGGPSINETLPELRTLMAEGAKIVTLNGAFQWCLDRNIIPHAQIVLDARPSSARFVQTYIERCRYYLASQCHADVWNTVRDYKHVGVWHAHVREQDNEPPSPETTLLDRFYLRHWHGVPGGTSVGTRAIALMRTLGYLRMDLFGIDSCWLDDQHHAFAQPENETDHRYKVTLTVNNTTARDFYVSAWHLQQADDMFRFIDSNGHNFALNVHGRGLIAFGLEALLTGDLQISPPTPTS